MVKRFTNNSLVKGINIKVSATEIPLIISKLFSYKLLGIKTKGRHDIIA